MKQFRIYKATFDGMCGGASELNLEQVLNECLLPDGFGSREHMNALITKWAADCQPGMAFQTRRSVVVCISSRGQIECECPECLSDDIDYRDLSPVEGGQVEQEASCNQCRAHWIDVWSPSERRMLAALR